MAVQSFNIEFDGYCREPDKGSLPTKSGIYRVYRCAHNAEEKSVSLKQLIYIGESVDVNSRVADHDRLDDWSALLRANEVLCYSFAPVSAADRIRVEAAMIFKHKPPKNTEYSQAFPFDQTTISIKGMASQLTPSFIVQRT